MIAARGPHTCEIAARESRAQCAGSRNELTHRGAFSQCGARDRELSCKAAHRGGDTRRVRLLRDAFQNLLFQGSNRQARRAG